MLRAIIVALILICCAADAAHAFRWPWIIFGHRHGHYYRRYTVPMPFDCDKIRAAMLDITPENWNLVRPTLTEAQIRHINECVVRLRP